jgi:phage-related protein (TIGR01555 family)
MDNPFSAPTEALTRTDASLMNILTEMGTSGDKSQYTMPGTSVKFSDNQLETLHEQPLINAYCSAIPDAAISKPLEFNFGSKNGDLDAKKSSEIIDWLDDFHVLEKTARAQTYANVYGGAAIVYFVDDGQPQDEPLNLKKVKKLLGTRVLDRQRVIPYIETATTLEDISHYDVSTHGVKIGIPGVAENAQIRFHKSRIIPFYGLHLTDNAMLQRYSGWGKSMIEAIWESYRDYRTAILASSGNLGDSSLAIVSMDGFIEMLRANDTETIKSVFASVKNMASNQGMMLIDKTKQDIRYVERQFTGVSQVIDKLREDFIGNSRIQHDKLFGESPSGLGATGEAEEKNWAKEVRQFQERRWRRLLRKQYEILLSLPDSPLKGKMPEQWSFKFPSIIELGEDQELANRATQSTIDSTYQSLGILTTDEIRQSRFAGSKFSYETTLDEKAYEEAKKKAEEEAAGYGGFGGYGDFGAGEEEQAIAPEEAPAEAVPEEEAPLQTDSVGRQKRLDAMRPSCMDCVTKHLGSALIKGREVENGYPEHIILVVGELSEAEQEVEAISQEAADMIRDLRRDCWAKRRSPMFEEVLAIYDVLGYDWSRGEDDDYEQEVEVPSYRKEWNLLHLDGKGKKKSKAGLKPVTKNTSAGHRQTYWIKPEAVHPSVARLKQGETEVDKLFREGVEEKAQKLITNGASVDIKAKAERIRNDTSSITEAEAVSLAEFISDDFHPISSALYKPESQRASDRWINQRKAVLAANALKKMPPATPQHISSEMEKDHKNNELERLVWKTKIDSEKKPRLLRYVDFAEEQVERYRSNVGKTITEDSFLSTTTEARETWFGDEATVAYEIEPKQDRGTNARYVDKYKNRLVEAEVVFPPGSKFEVVGVISDQSIYPEREKLSYVVPGSKLKESTKRSLLDPLHDDELDLIESKKESYYKTIKSADEARSQGQGKNALELEKSAEDLIWGMKDNSWNIQQRIKENGVNTWYDEASSDFFFVIGGQEYSVPVLDRESLKGLAGLVEKSVYKDQKIPVNKKKYNHIIQLREV